MSAKPAIRKLGTIDCDMVETTPVVFRGKVYRFEWVRGRYLPNTGCVPYFRFIDHETGEATPAFAKGHIFGSAFVVGDTVYVTGVVSEGGWKGQRIIIQTLTIRNLCLSPSLYRKRRFRLWMRWRNSWTH